MACLLNTVITTAATTNGVPFVVGYRHGVKGITMQVIFTYGSGGTNCDVKVQTSLDGGSTWIDIWHCTQFTTSNGQRAAFLALGTNVADTDATAALTAGNLQAILGGHLRATVTNTGTYAGGTTVQVDVFAEQLAPA